MFPASRGSLVSQIPDEKIETEPLPTRDCFSYCPYSSTRMHMVTEVAISCSDNSFFGMIIGLLPVKPDINWFCLSTVVDGDISNKAS